MPLSVYVEGSKDASAAGVKRLASLIAARYGLAAADLEKRIAAGRFRVKANVDAATAHAFASDLEALGAQCSIVEAEVSGPVRGLRGIPALEHGAASGASGASADPATARALTPSSARTITASAVPPPQAARTATPAANPGHRAAHVTTGSSAALRPASGLAAATSVREPDSSSLNPPTLRSSTGLSAATVRPPEAPHDPLNPATMRGASGLSAATVRPPGEALGDASNPPTLRGLSSTSRTPASSTPPLASRTATLPFAGFAQRPGSSSSPPHPGSSNLASALADATYSAPSASSGLGALDGASFSLATLDGEDDGAPSVASSAAASIAASPYAGAAYDEPPDYDTDSSYTPTLAFDEPPAPPAPAYDSYPPRRPGTGRTSTPLRPATSSGMSQLRAPTNSPVAGPVHGAGNPPITGSGPALRPSSSSIPAPAARPSAPAIDLFAPPPEAGPAQLHLAEELPRQRVSALAPPRNGPEGAPMVAPAIASPFVPRAGSDAATAKRLRDRLRLAFAAGVLASVVIGFAPAHLVAKSRERTAFERIDNRARIAQSEISSMAEWNALDDVRTALLRQKRAAQQEIAMLAVLLWIGVTGALSFAWFRFGLARFDPSRDDSDD